MTNQMLICLAHIYEIPVDNETFDSATCTAALEHLKEPEQALRKCHRVLKPASVLNNSVPFFWRLHEEPRDFYRYSKYSHKYIIEAIGFEIVELKAFFGFWVTFVQISVYNIYRFRRGSIRYFPIIPVFRFAIQGVSYVLDRIDKNEQWTWMYTVVTRKT